MLIAEVYILVEGRLLTRKLRVVVKKETSPKRYYGVPISKTKARKQRAVLRRELKQVELELKAIRQGFGTYASKNPEIGSPVT